MEYRTHSGPGGEAASARAARLREEIDFWAGMLAAADDSVPAASVERMSFALALAEFRLRALPGAARDTAEARGAVLPFTRDGG